MPREMNDIGLVAVMSGGVQVGEDVAVVAGDFTVVPSTNMHQRQLLQNGKNDFKQNPDCTVGIMTFIDDEGPGAVVREIAKKFMLDGMDIDSLIPNQAAATDSTVAPFLDAYYV